MKLGKYARARAAVAALLTAIGAIALLGVAPSAAQAAAPGAKGCNYGEAGAQQSYGGTICWIDMAGLDPATASSPAGQPMSVQFSDAGGNPTIQMKFTVRYTPGVIDGTPVERTIAATPFPTWRDAAFGKDAYKNTAGAPALYQSFGGKTEGRGESGKVQLDNITVTSNGTRVTSGYSLVMGDAESTNSGEGFTWTSTSPIKDLAVITTPANAQGQKDDICELSGIGTKTVTCVGKSGKYAETVPVDARVVYTEAPTAISSSFVTKNRESRQGIALGVMFAKAQVTKTVFSRYDSADQFKVNVQEVSNATPLDLGSA